MWRAASHPADQWARSAEELRVRVTRAASAYALQQSSFNRGNLARAMRRAVAAGIDPGEVTARAVLPREEAEQIIETG